MENSPIGHNGGPPIDVKECIAEYKDSIEEAGNWLDGTVVKDECQMAVVDALIKDVRAAKVTLEKAKKSATAPLHDAWKAEGARWKPTEDDIKRRLEGLVAAVEPFKKELAAKAEAARRAAYKEAERKRLEAEKAAMNADPKNYEDSVQAAKLAQEAQDAKAEAAKLKKPKGLRKVSKFNVFDNAALLKWVVENDREEVVKFLSEYARKNHKDTKMDGVESWVEKEAY